MSYISIVIRKYICTGSQMTEVPVNGTQWTDRKLYSIVHYWHCMK